MPAGSLIDATVGAYRLVDFLGAGGMGEVYRGVHSSLERDVAVKVLSGAGSTPALIERFRNEARIHSSLHHPNIATLFDFAELAGRPCIIMEFVDGDTLDERIHRGSALPAGQALQILAAVTEAVGYLHEHGIVHRDLKSSNIKITTGGVVKLLDFGLARGRGTPRLTRTGQAIGTFDYMAPEQLAAGTVDGRADIWALGVVLYESVTGHLPFAPTGALDPTGRIPGARYFPASTLVPSLPAPIDAIIGRCLRPDPADRFPGAAELLAEINAARARLSGAVPSTPKPVAPADMKPAAAPAPAGRRRLDPRWAALIPAVGLLIWLTTVLGPDRAPRPSASEGHPGLACGIAPDNAPSQLLRQVEINVIGGAADVYCGERIVGRTPFAFQAALGSEVRVVLRERGWAEKQVAFTVGEGSRTWSFVLSRP